MLKIPHLPIRRAALPTVLAVALAVINAAAMSAEAAEPDPEAKPFGETGLPFSDPQAMWESMFGEPTAEDEHALAAVQISHKEEERFGKPIFEAYLARLKRQRIRVLKRGRDVEYLQKLVAELRPFMRNNQRYKTIHVYLADSPRIDARSFAGGRLVFFRGLLDFAESEAALAGIVGHELSHLDHGHQLVPLRRARLMQRTFSGGPQAFSLERFFKSGTQLMRLSSRPFRPQDEATADRDGARWACQAGYDPRELARLFLRLSEKKNDQGTGIPSFFRTHPNFVNRYEAVLAQSVELQQTHPQEPLYVGRENLRRRIPRVEQQFDE